MVAMTPGVTEETATAETSEKIEATETKRTWIEEVATTGESLVGMVKRLVKEGNVRRVTVTHDDHVLVELPLTLGVVGALLAPQLAALGAIAALVTSCTIKVERETPPAPEMPGATPADTAPAQAAAPGALADPPSGGLWLPGQPEHPTPAVPPAHNGG